jgi:hypothetical protein
MSWPFSGKGPLPKRSGGGVAGDVLAAAVREFEEEPIGSASEDHTHLLLTCN